jgi:hypothetical protein
MRFIFFIGLSVLLTGCYQHHDKETYIDNFVSSENYNQFFKDHYDESVLFISAKEIEDYNQYFRSTLEDFKKGYSVIATDNKFYSYVNDNKIEKKYLEIGIIAKSNNRIARFKFLENESNVWVFDNITFEGNGAKNSW